MQSVSAQATSWPPSADSGEFRNIVTLINPTAEPAWFCFLRQPYMGPPPSSQSGTSYHFSGRESSKLDTGQFEGLVSSKLRNKYPEVFGVLGGIRFSWMSSSSPPATVVLSAPISLQSSLNHHWPQLSEDPRWSPVPSRVVLQDVLDITGILGSRPTCGSWTFLHRACRSALISSSDDLMLSVHDCTSAAKEFLRWRNVAATQC